MARPPKDPSELSQTPNAIRKRLRRKAGDAEGVKAEAEVLYGKPIEEWDLEELARGKPRSKDGTFAGPKPSAALLGVTTTELHNRLKSRTRTELGAMTSTALRTLADLMTSTETDDEGRPVVPASVKADTAKYVIDHIIGKAKVSVDIEGPGVIEFLQQFSGGLVKRAGEAYTPKVIEGEPVSSVDTESDDTPLALPAWEPPIPTRDEPASITRISRASPRRIT